MADKGVISLIFDLKLSCLAKEEKIREELNLSPAEYKGILTIEPGSSLPCSKLSKAMGLSVSRGSRVIDKLIKNGYLKADSAAKDRRVMNVFLTSKGFRIQTKIHNLLEECESIILSKFSKTELTSLENSLMKISKILITK